MLFWTRWAMWPWPKNRDSRLFMAAINWMFPDPAPAWMSSAAFWISIVALVLAVVALPTTLQMFFGKPKITIRFSDDAVNGGHRLKCFFSNKGIKSRFLRWLGVVRVPVQIEAMLFLTEYKTDKVIIPLLRLHLSTDRESGLHVHLPFSIMGARAFVIGYNAERDTFVIPQNDERDATILNPGIYCVRVDVVTAYQALHTESRYLVVGQHKPYWTDRVFT
jgi:hypothetical protein